MIPSPEVKELGLQDYLEIIKKRKKVIFRIITFLLAATILYDLFGTRVYKAETTILIEKKTLSIAEKSDQDIYTAAEIRDIGYYATQYELLKSRSLAKRVIDRLDPKRYREYTRRKSVGKILRAVHVKPLIRTNIVQLYVLERNPKKAAEIANLWAEEYIQQAREKKSESAKYGVTVLEDQLLDTMDKLRMAEDKLNDFIKENHIVETPDIENKKELLIDQLKMQKTDLEQQIGEASEKYGKNYPQMIYFNAQLKTINDQLEDETAKFMVLQEKMAEYKILKREVDTYSSLYNDILQRGHELDTFKDIGISNIQVVDPAEVPKTPIRPNPKKDIPFAIFLGLFLGILIPFLLEYLDTTLRTSEEVELYAKIPFLGYMPLVRGEALDERGRNLVVHQRPKSIVSEAFRHLRVSTMFSAPTGKDLKSILVASALPMEGKTFIASNLAINFAKAGEKTLLVDADMRLGSLSRTFETKAMPGLSAVLEGECDVEKTISDTPVPNLYFLNSGTHVQDPTDLLGKANFVTLIEKIKSKFKRVIIDVPSILNFGDALFWADKSDGTVLVIEAGKTPLKQIDEAKKAIAASDNVCGGEIIGAILNNKEETEDKDFYYYYDYFYTFLEKGVDTIKKIQEHDKSPDQ
ncbi:GumC family protein [Candidatus Omnitrophota bacterium]